MSEVIFDSLNISPYIIRTQLLSSPRKKHNNNNHNGYIEL